MDASQLENYILEKKGAAKDFPFGPETVVFKVCNKMFALIGWKDDAARVNLKSDPQEAIALRSMFPSVTPGYHMNKEHWNTVFLDGTVPEPVIRKMVDDSYQLVVKSLRKKDRQSLEEL